MAKNSFNRSGGRRRGRRCSLSDKEEELVILLLLRYARRGIPLLPHQLKQAIEIIVSRMTPGRRVLLQSKNGSPGAQYVREFTQLHRERIMFARRLRQEALRFNGVKAEVLTTHFATIDKIIYENNIDGVRIWNCDESGATPGRDANGKHSSRVYLNRSGSRDAKIGHF